MALTPGQIVRESRESAGLTRFQLAQKVGVSISTIDRLENRDALPKPTALGRIACELGLSVDALLGVAA